jgi:hypothetical protein
MAQSKLTSDILIDAVIGWISEHTEGYKREPEGIFAQEPEVAIPKKEVPLPEQSAEEKKKLVEKRIKALKMSVPYSEDKVSLEKRIRALEISIKYL